MTAVLMSTHSQKMSLIELVKGYNQAFRSEGQEVKVEGAELLQVIKTLPNFKVQQMFKINFK